MCSSRPNPGLVAASSILFGLSLLGLLLGLAGCGGGGGGGSGGTATLSPGNAELLTVQYGRLVDVFGFVRDANGVTVADLLTPGTYQVEVIERPDLPPSEVEIAEGAQTAVSIPL